ncbi:hypothetical protein ACFOQM_22140 [Paenibacillus sp. GCM10012307]|uniref:Uncharacterized protein n=1 Tax=Paenibacillus roseus TaxID=2798579 RepID=A0A934J375_9BACL|nr:hypothetical protein [Paenibacillus roseus]MBJ6363931.1 hypothetical protein [Paenibacillus roseus]
MKRNAILTALVDIPKAVLLYLLAYNTESLAKRTRLPQTDRAIQVTVSPCVRIVVVLIDEVGDNEASE